MGGGGGRKVPYTIPLQVRHSKKAMNTLTCVQNLNSFGAGSIASVNSVP